MYSQITDSIFMVKPVHFKRNEQTAVNNYFQVSDHDFSMAEAQEKALNEFDLFVEKLRQEKIEVEVFEDTESSDTPDSIFPNNWITLHDDGTIILYPMFALNRRKERREDVVNKFKRKFYVSQVYSFTHWEEKGLFLEGTGSLILDRPQKVAYAALSDRTCSEVLDDFADKTGYETVPFHANQTVDGRRLPIYHTNVMMSLGDRFAIICLNSIDDEWERENVLFSLEKTHKEVINISEEQVTNFAGNILQVKNNLGEHYIVMSNAAFESYSEQQLQKLEKHGKILSTPIPTIQMLGGGGVRCMMAEIFLPTPTLKPA